MPTVADAGETRKRYLRVWNGEFEISALPTLLTSSYLGHLGSRDRDATQLADDIAAYRRVNPTIRFEIEDEFWSGARAASRVVARGTDGLGRQIAARGINISRFEEGLLAEEWAVWEALAPIDR